MITIVKGRDKEFVIRLTNQDDEPISLENWTSIRCRFLKSDRSVLTLISPLTSAVNEVQKLTFNDLPISGSFKIQIDDVTSGAIAFDAVAQDVEDAINAMEAQEGVTVAGDFSLGFTITFAGLSGGRDYPLIVIVDNTLQDGGDVTVTPTVTVEGVPESGIEVVNQYTGKLRIVLSEDDTALLKEGVNDFDLVIKLGSSDLNILPQYKALDVKEAPF